MATKRLTNSKVDALKPRGKKYLVSDGERLFLMVMPNGTKRWVSKIAFQGHDLVIGLGLWPEVSIAEARQRHAENRAHARAGRDPRLPMLMSFRDLAEKWLKLRAPGWTPDYAEQNRRLLELHLLPKLGRADPAKIGVQDVLRAVEPVCRDRGATGHKVLGIVSRVMRYGVVLGAVQADPCRDLRGALPALRGQKHHATLEAPEEIGRLMLDIDAYGGSLTVRDALRFTAWTAGRAQEIVGARWDEIDMARAVWTVPAERMKKRRTHRVPLPRQCLAMLKELKVRAGDSPFLFPSLTSKTRHVSSNALLFALRRMDWSKESMTLHGFRGMFSTATNASGLWSGDLVEAQLSHEPDNAVRAAYNHTDYLDRRREMMQWYADWLDGLKTKATGRPPSGGQAA
ncbi:MAG: tyrosine-type recombinase/integrase [Desulfovibrio sp.]|nr:tyrosine-type recombinase/integrase [Desulfovibrio sp.]